MKYFIIIISILIFIIFFPIPLKISILFIEKKLSVYIYNINVHKKKLTSKNTFKLSNLKDNKFSYFKKRKTKASLDLSLNYGLDDAFETAILYGVLCGALNSILLYLSQYIKFKQNNHNKINITPDYNHNKLEFNIKCIIYLSLVKIIYILVKLLFNSKEDKARRSLNE
ncbi:DUF2953 domain-containing protein [Hathewaya histolytica]|uniref:DUF2953 domain-containing protein n=1 Tax=Hathewaya histolytica TaxID=1498 RepID=UPI003B6804BA